MERGNRGGSFVGYVCGCRGGNLREWMIKEREMQA